VVATTGELDLTATAANVDINAATTVTIDGTTLTLTAAGAGNDINLVAADEIDLTPSGLVDINAGTDVTIDTAGAGDEILLTTDTGGISVRVGGATVDPDDGELDVTTSGTVDINAGSSVTVDSVTTTAITATTTATVTGGTGATVVATTGELDLTATAANVDINAGTAATLDAATDISITAAAAADSDILAAALTGGVAIGAGNAAANPADGEVDITNTGTVDINAGTTLTLDTTAGAITLTSGGAGNDIELLPADVVVLGSVANGLSITTAGVISDANAAVQISDTFQLGTDGSTLTDITVLQQADGANGWDPDGATGVFTVTAGAAAITTDAVISISLDNGSAANAACSVVDVTAATSFVIRCSENTVPNGAVLNIMIVDP
jgi:hypothetical protein